MKRLIQYGLALLITSIFVFICLPVLNLKFISLYFTLFIFFAAIAATSFLADTEKEKLITLLIPIGLIGVIIIGIFVSSPVFHAKEYKNLIGDVKESKFTDDISPVSVNDIRLVDESMARKLGDKKLGEVSALGSVSQIGTFNIQSVNGKLYWVAPLEYRGFVKWLTTDGGTKGYIKVSASNPKDVQLVQKVGNRDINIVYQPNAYFMEDLHRHLYFNGLKNVGVHDFTIELDENGIPYWVASIYKHKIGFGGYEITGTAIVDVETGEFKTYSIKDTPKWVDRIQPIDVVESQIMSWGSYINGFWNSIFSEKGVLTPTDGTSLVYGKDGKSYWYTGITSSGADDSTVGFMLVDSRTKETKFFKQSGATEQSARSSAEGAVQEKDYKATYPITYNILNQPTYVMSLKDKAGLVKMVAFVSVEDYNIIGIGSNKTEALKEYENALVSDGNNLTFNNGDKIKEEVLEGNVTRINQDVDKEGTIYYLTIDSKEKVVFKQTSKVSYKLPLTQVGDKIKITFNNTNGNIINILTFDNLNI